MASIANNPTEQLAVVSHIKDFIRRNKAKEIPNGAVVKFRYKTRSTREAELKHVKRDYVALYVGNRWWTTSVTREGNVPMILSNQQFLDLLARPEVSKVAVASAWDEID